MSAPNKKNNNSHDEAAVVLARLSYPGVPEPEEQQQQPPTTSTVGKTQEGGRPQPPALPPIMPLRPDTTPDCLVRTQQAGKPSVKSNVPMPFPEKLMEILSNESISNIITWLPHGKGFAILKKNRFANEVMPLYFKQSKYTSFTRKLKRWGFTRVTAGTELGAYYHKFFHRGNHLLCMQMQCNSGTSSSAKFNPDLHRQNELLHLEKQSEQDALLAKGQDISNPGMKFGSKMPSLPNVNTNKSNAAGQNVEQMEQVLFLQREMLEAENRDQTLHRQRQLLQAEARQQEGQRMDSNDVLQRQMQLLKEEKAANSEDRWTGGAAVSSGFDSVFARQQQLLAKDATASRGGTASYAMGPGMGMPSGGNPPFMMNGMPMNGMPNMGGGFPNVPNNRGPMSNQEMFAYYNMMGNNQGNGMNPGMMMGNNMQGMPNMMPPVHQPKGPGAGDGTANILHGQIKGVAPQVHQPHATADNQAGGDPQASSQEKDEAKTGKQDSQTPAETDKVTI